MRSLCIGLLLLAAGLTEACMSNDPNELTGTPLLRPRTNHAKAVRADDDLDDALSDDDDDDVASKPVKKTIEQQCFEVINKYRAKKGLTPFKRWTAKESCAATECKSDSQSGKAHGAFGQCGEMAQNECPGYPSPPEKNLPECLADMWAEGPGGGHYDHMSSTEYTMVSCGVYETDDGKFWSVQNFK